MVMMSPVRTIPDALPSLDGMEETEWKIEYSNDGINWKEAEVRITKVAEFEAHKFKKEYNAV